MGIFSRIGNWFRRILGVKPREEPEEKKPERKYTEPKTNIIAGIPLNEQGYEKSTGKERVDQERTEFEKEVEILRRKKKEEELEKKSKIDRFKERNKSFKPKFTFISDTRRKEWTKLINPSNTVIQTKYYGSYEELLNSEYDIYRNVIMGAIKSDTDEGKKIVQQIFQSGVLDEHIVGIVRIKVQSQRKDNSRFEGTIEYEVLGLTPRKAINKEIHRILMSMQGTTTFEIRRTLERLCETELHDTGKFGETTCNVTGVEISFNYA